MSYSTLDTFGRSIRNIRSGRLSRISKEQRFGNVTRPRQHTTANIFQGHHLALKQVNLEASTKHTGFLGNIHLGSLMSTLISTVDATPLRLRFGIPLWKSLQKQRRGTTSDSPLRNHADHC